MAENTRPVAFLLQHLFFCAAGTSALLAPNFLPFLPLCRLFPQDLSLDLGQQPEPSVIYSSGPDKIGPCSESLGKLLFRTAFWRYRVRGAKHVTGFKGRDPALAMDDVVDAVRRVGFVPEWFSDTTCFCGSYRRSLVSIDQVLMRWPLWVRIASNDPEELKAVSSALQQQSALVEQT